jgi:hypothetical protein
MQGGPISIPFSSILKRSIHSFQSSFPTSLTLAFLSNPRSVHSLAEMLFYRALVASLLALTVAARREVVKKAVTQDRYVFA